MMQKPWFKIFIWFIATFFFFLAAGVLISIFRPGPTEGEVMQFMSGMMSAMDRSMMGVAMGVENDVLLSTILLMAGNIAIPVIITGIAAGFGIRIWQRRGKDV